MKNERTKIYIKVCRSKSEIVYSGIDFKEFIAYLSTPINNIILLKADYVSDKRQNNFDLIEGRDNIAEFVKKNTHSYGDFCFVDYAPPDCFAELDKNQIAELLYLAHIFNPLKTPFFKKLQNCYSYLAHDDGWYCKLYCRNLSDFATVLCEKIKRSVNTRFSDNICLPSEIIKDQILKLAENGLLIDLEESSCKNGNIDITCYIIGEYSNMDKIFNYYQQVKNNASQIIHLKCCKAEWEIS